MAEGVTGEFLKSIWDALGGDPGWLGQLAIEGEGAMPCCLPMTDLGTASFAATGAAVAELTSLAEETAPKVEVDRLACYAWLRMAETRPVGPRPERRGPFHDISTDYETADGRWVRFQANYEHLRAATLAALDVKEDRAAIADLIRRHGADEIEQRIVDGGGAAAASRSIDEWLEHPQGRAVAAEPLVDVAVGATVHEPWMPTPERPLAGVRVLDLTRVLAGPLATRCLAGYGAEVLRLDPPGYAEPGGSSGGELMLGKRCAHLDLKSDEGHEAFLDLLSQADVFVHGLRPGVLDRLDLSRDVRERCRPGLVEVTLDAYGWTGPWRDRRGFDTLVQSSSGLADAGMRWAATPRPFRWPFSVLDHVTGYLMAAAAVRGLTRRVQTGQGSTSRVSLARTSALLVSAGEQEAQPELAFPVDGPFEARLSIAADGPLRRLHWPVAVAGAPVFWERPGDPYGSAIPTWTTSSDACRLG
ncbi:MAG: CoA transferase [Acidimicrobiaceae bacterium]|nr:CoA transferase [Acidimicrobiaceae bacterium]